MEFCFILLSRFLKFKHICDNGTLKKLLKEASHSR